MNTRAELDDLGQRLQTYINNAYSMLRFFKTLKENGISGSNFDEAIVNYESGLEIAYKSMGELLRRYRIINPPSNPVDNVLLPYISRCNKCEYIEAIKVTQDYLTRLDESGKDYTHCRECGYRLFFSHPPLPEGFFTEGK